MYNVRVEHVAIWTPDLERLKEFYRTYFQARPSAKYVNPAKQFESYFLTFSSGARLELMRRADVHECSVPLERLVAGYAHVAISVGSPERVDALTTRLEADGYRVVDGPRRTGDGYYESSVLDPDGNRIEITV